MKLRKTVACILAVLQLGFGAFLTAKAAAEERAAARHGEEIVRLGTAYDVAVQSIYMIDGGKGSVRMEFTVYAPEYTNARFMTASQDEKGLLRFTQPADIAPPTGPYVKPELLRDALFRGAALSPDAAALLFRPEDESLDSYWVEILQGDKLTISGTRYTFCVRAVIYEGEIVFTGAVIDGAFYAFEKQ